MFSSSTRRLISAPPLETAVRFILMLLATTLLLNALQTHLTGCELNGAKVFDQVQVTSSQDMDAALEQVFSSDRSCLLFPLGDEYETKIHGRMDSVDRTTEIMLQITTRDYSMDNAQLTGSASDPGLLVLKDLVLSGEAGKNNGLLGSNLGQPGVKVLPGAGALVQLEKAESDIVVATRHGWSQILRIRAGHQMI